MDSESLSRIPRPFVIHKKINETADTFTLELKPQSDDRDFPFEAGQFNMLYVFGFGDVPISISGDPSGAFSLLHTIRSVGNVTKAISKLKRGETLGVRGPYGAGWPIKEANGKDVVIVAGGIGLAPLRPLIYEIISNRDHYGKVNILYGARLPEDLLYRKELEKWRAVHDIDTLITVDRSLGFWHGAVGVVTTLIHKARFDPLNTKAFICGPEVMMRFTVAELLNKGLDAGDVYVSMERNMNCGVGLCGRCQFGPVFICKDGPVFSYDSISHLLNLREV